jgi:hypothetical protein
MSAALCVNRLDAERRAKPLPRKQFTLLPLPGGMHFRDQAIDLLRRWPELLPILEEASKKLREFFGQEPALILKSFVAPDSPSEEPTLFLLIGTRLSAEDAGAIMDRFEEAWWFDNAHRTEHLHINLEFA